MPKVILICGKICCGKTTYAKKVAKEQNAVLLSCDEIMLTLFGQYCDKQDEMVEKTTIYLLNKSIELFTVGVNVILDVGFWTRAYREEVNDFYKQMESPQNGIILMYRARYGKKVWKSEMLQ